MSPGDPYTFICQPGNNRQQDYPAENTYPPVIQDREESVQDCEKDDCHDDEEEYEACAASWMECGVFQYIIQTQITAGFICVDGFMLGAVVLKYAFDVRDE